MSELSEVIPIGEWMPDKPDYKNGGCLIARNVISNGEGYIPFPQLQAISGALPAKCLGAYSYIAQDGTVATFAGTPTALYKLNGANWEDVSKAGGYTGSNESSWKFVQFGTVVIATNYVDKMQKFNVGTDTEFSDLITSGVDVKCRNFGIINNFLVCVDIDDDAGNTPNRVRWSPINNPAGDWASSPTTQADYQNLEDGNPQQCMAIIGSQNMAAGQSYGLIICKNAIYRMDYVGSDTVFTFQLLETGRGAISENAVVSNGIGATYLSDTGLYDFNGVQSLPIGHGKIDKYITDSIDKQLLSNVTMCADPTRKLVLLSYTSMGGGSSRNDKTLVYNWGDGRFTELDSGYEAIFSVFSQAWTLEQIGAAYPNIDTVPISLDNRYWQGGFRSIGAISSSGIHGTFTGEPMEAILESQDVRLNTSGMSYIESVLPVFEGGDCVLRIGHKMLTSDATSYTDYYAPSSLTGEVSFEKDTRYVRATVKLTGSWLQFQGLQFRAGKSGEL